ncbi:Zinc finger protein jing [Toxocara canis]|uniref:Zinc finger protein jing n=1 Tax=Toxocara canis TaxID=6265 RepID=A0A0B2VVH5_TOXCA|nr:Zinc finger protein jing [Toxocara canis]
MSAAKNMLNMGRMSPASVDSGFDSSFPSSPDSSSIDSPRLHATVVSDTLRCLTTNISPTKCPLLLKEAHIPEPCCSSRSSPSLSSSGYGSSLPSSASQTSLSSFSSRVDCLDLSSLKEPLSIVCERPESVFVQPVDLPNVIDSEHSSNHNGEKADEELKVESFTDCPSTSSSTCYIDEPSLTSRQERLRSECHWDKCTNRFRCDNDMYDHVVKNHLEPLRPPDCLSPTSRGRCSPKSRLKNLACKWGDCKMVMSRGDIKKQFLWLEDHFATRHAGKAQPYRCLIEGCSLRFTLKRALEDHLRSGHEKAKEKRTHAEEGDLGKPKSCFQWTPLPYYPPCENRDFLDRATEEWIIMRLREYERTSNARLVVQPPPTPRGGAAYRKRRRLLTFAVESFKAEPPTKVMNMSEKKRLLKDAFKMPSPSRQQSTVPTNGKTA